MFGILVSSARVMSPICYRCRVMVLPKLYYSEKWEKLYNDDQKHKILQVINENRDELSKYDITKTRLKKFIQWKNNIGTLNKLTDIEMVDGFSEKTAKKLFDSILNGPIKDVEKLSPKIKGQILHPHLSDSVVKECRSVLTVYITVNSVCWILIDKANYEVVEWKYHPIDYPDGKRLQITDIMDISWRIIHELPSANIYVMKAEATTLRATGNDPNNPKLLAVNLQKAQMVAMIVALINASDNRSRTAENDNENVLKHKVYFLRPTLPYRLYGTLVGGEKVSTEQTVEILLRDTNENLINHVKVPQDLKNMFREKEDLEKDMLGHCFLLGITFMDLCVYKNQERVAKLMKFGP